MNRSLKRFLPILRITLTFVLLAWVIVGVDTTSVLQIIGSFRIRFLVLLIALQLVMRFVMAIQLRTNTNILQIDLSIWVLFKINVVMAFYSLIVPGELISGGIGWLKITSEGAAKWGALAAISITRWINTFILFLIGLIMVGLEKSIEIENLSWILFTFVILLAFGYGFMLLDFPFLRSQKILSPRTNKNPPWIIKVLIQIERLWKEFRSLRLVQHIKLIGYGLIVHVIGSIIHLLIARELNIDLSWTTILWIRSLIMILGMLPISVGGFGIHESSLVFLLGQFSVSNEIAIVYSFLIVLSVIGVGIIGGVIELRDSTIRSGIDKYMRHY